jgi:ATP-dependent Clp protease ATP-binding subunit ClpA
VVLESFTEDARQVVVRAEEESRQLGHNAIGVEHLLIGVVRTDPELLPVAAEDVRAQVAERLATATPRAEEKVPFTNGAKGALQRSLSNALAQGNRQIAPEHLLMALLVDERVAAIVRSCGE